MIRTALVLAAMATPTLAQDRASILIGSRHIGAGSPAITGVLSAPAVASSYREVNPGLFLTWDGAPVDVTVGVYANSYGRISLAALASVPVIDWDGGALEVFGGVALYPQDGRRFALHAGDVVPLAGLTARHGTLFAQIMPGDGRNADAVVAFGLTFPLGDTP